MYPRRPLLWLTGALALAGVAAAFVPLLQTVVLACCAAAALLAVLDALALLRLPAPEVSRHVSHTLSLGTWTRVALTVTASRRCRLTLFDHHPQRFDMRGLPLRVDATPGRQSTVDYDVRPNERGDHAFAACDVRIQSPLGLFAKRRRLALTDRIFVYPNFAAVTKYALQVSEAPLNQGGIRRQRRRGEGLEFHQLREYRDGDTFRQIDWKASARTRKLISKEYQDERDQAVVFLLDTGRRMLTREGRFSHFDHVLNAMLLLSYVALRQGDAVGVYATGDSPRWIVPRKGVAAINPLLRQIYDLQPAPRAIDFAAAATELAVRQKRRALVVLLTNVRDEDNDDLQAAVRLLRRRHLVLIASLRESAVDDALAEPVSDLPSALTYSAALNYLDARRKTHTDLSASGVYVHDTVCETLPALITNRYLAIKRAGLL
ncbi:MAG: DUF58 domain-containing protein [Pseudomonadota bacterium]